jgi:hypothetical protein
MKKYIFLFFVVNFSNLFSVSKISMNSNDFLEVINKAEAFYQQQDGDKSTKFTTLSEKLKVRHELYQFKKQFDVYLNKCQTSNEAFDPQEYEMVVTLFLPLLKVVISNLEGHLKKEHNWVRPRHFSRIAKPLVLGATLVVSLITLAKILEKTDAISTQDYKEIRTAIEVGGIGLTGLWIAYNYKDVIARKFSAAF